MAGNTLARCGVALLIWCPAAYGTPLLLTAWEARYPTSTLPDRMEGITGSRCHTCHHPAALDAPGNCYREDFSALLQGGMDVDSALEELDAMDSDGDGIENGKEAIEPHADLPGEIGYNMGLIGPTGTDPCSDDPGQAITGVSETPAILKVPAMSEWGLAVLMLLLMTAGTLVMAQRRRVGA